MPDTTSATGAILSPAVPGPVGFLAHLAQSLHAHGCPSHQLEDTLGRVSSHLGVDAQYFSTPTAVFVELNTSVGRTTRMLRMEPGDSDLGRLRAVDDLVGRVLDGSVDAAQAELALRAIDRRAPLWGPGSELASFALASSAAARFLGGGLPEVVAGLVVGAAVGLLPQLLGQRRESRRLFELLAAALAAFLALAAAQLAVVTGLELSISTSIATVAGLIVLVPGMTLTLALTELATRNLVSGSARLAGAAVTLFTIGFGVAIGDHAGRAVWPREATADGNVGGTTPLTTLLLDGGALLAIAIAFTVLFRARRRDAGWMLLASGLAWGSILIGSRLLGGGLGALAASFTVGLAGNLISRRSGRPAALIHVPGLMLLVPGSLGLRSLGSLLADDTLLGIQGLVETSLTAIALATGLLLAHAVAAPRRGL